MAPTIKVADDLYREIGRFGNRDETWNDVLARLINHVDEEAALTDRDNRTTTHSANQTATGESGLAQLEDGTVVMHWYQRGDYSGQSVEATVQGDGLSVPGDTQETRTPTGAARVADKKHRGDDARGEGYNGWMWWNFKNEEGEWEPIDILKY